MLPYSSRQAPFSWTNVFASINTCEFIDTFWCVLNRCSVFNWWKKHFLYFVYDSKVSSVECFLQCILKSLCNYILDFLTFIWWTDINWFLFGSECHFFRFFFKIFVDEVIRISIVSRSSFILLNSVSNKSSEQIFFALSIKIFSRPILYFTGTLLLKWRYCLFQDDFL